MLSDTNVSENEKKEQVTYKESTWGKTVDGFEFVNIDMSFDTPEYRSRLMDETSWG